MDEMSTPEDVTVTVELLAAIVTSVAAIVVAIISKFSNRDRRMRLLSDLEILGKLDSGTVAYEVLKASIDRRIIDMSDTGAKTRDWTGFTIGILFLLIGIILLPVINSLGGWWRTLHAVTVFLLFFGVFGTISSALKKPRDEKGNTIKTPSGKDT